MKDVMLVVLLVALSNFIAGSIIGPENDIEASRGFIGYNSKDFFNCFLKIDQLKLIQFTVTLLNENWNPSYISSSGHMQNFLSVFTVYFPAAIGSLAGANVSGDLKVIYLIDFHLIIVDVLNHLNCRIRTPQYRKERF